MKTLLASIALVAVAATLSPAQDPSKAKLEASPRHGEWVEIKHGDRTVKAFIVYPEIKEKAPVVVVIHEIFGLADWVRNVTDQFAEAGFIAIAPDLLSGLGENGGGTEALGGGDGVRKAISSLPPDQITADLDAVAAYATKLPAANGKLAVAGFCWGGSQSFRYATSNKNLAAAMVFYGTGPMDPPALEKVACPVYGFYGGNDARVNATIPDSEKLMKAAGKAYEPVTYEGAGHGFMRAAEMPGASEPNVKARKEAWDRIKKILGSI